MTGGTRLYSISYLDDLEDEVKKLKGHVTLLRLTLTHARDKLEVNRDHSDGAYHGGIEHTKLIGNIRTTMDITGPEDEDGD